MGNIGWVQLLILLLIVVLLFGTSRLRNLGGDLGQALRGFRKAFSEDEESTAEERKDPDRLTETTDQPAGDEEPARDKDRDRG